MVSPVSRFAFEDLRLGQQAAFEATVTEADLDRFAEVSGDVSPLHMDAGFARARGFAGRVAHGAYLTALVSRLVGVHLPGERCLLHSVAMQFRRPVLAGTRVVVTGVVEQLSEAVRSAVIKVAVQDAATGEAAATGRASVGFTDAVGSSWAPRGTPGRMAEALPVRLWTMPVGGLREADLGNWYAVLDRDERERVARFAFERNRVEYIAAHALTRALLSAVTGEPPRAFRYQAGDKGKPVALCDGRRLDVHFNLSHSNGIVAVAATHGVEIGVDTEPVDRKVDLAVADRYFFGAEARWLAGLDPSRRTEGFLRLWTLKEAYIKATGRGLSQALDEFWFDVEPPRIRFTPAIADDAAAWRFRQMVAAERFLVAVGWRAGPDGDRALVVEEKAPAELAFGLAGTLR